MLSRTTGKEIPEPTLRRLPWYLAFVTLLHSRGIEYVSSTRIAEELHVDASQIAKDLSYLDIKGKTRIGYEVATLEERLNEFLGFRRLHKAAVVGAGSLGAALIHDTGLENYGLDIKAGFDINPSIVDSEIEGTRIYHTDRLNEVCQSLGITVAILTVPFDSAQTMADRCIDAGIRAIWNFTARRLDVRPGAVVQNTSIYSDLALMYNRLKSDSGTQE